MPKERRGVSPTVRHERQYLSTVVRLLDETVFSPALHALNAFDSQRYVAQLEQIKQRIKDDPNYGRQEAEAAAKRIRDTQRASFAQVLHSVRIDLLVFERTADPQIRQTIEVFLNENVGLIKNVANESLGTLQEFVHKQVVENTFDLHAQQANVQQYLEGVGQRKARNRAKLITRDQNNKLVGQLNQIDHKAAGGEEYRWSTSHDERVRDSHAALDGRIFRWDTPPQPDGHPGNGIQCRCIAKPIFRTSDAEKQLTTGQIERKLGPVKVGA